MPRSLWNGTIAFGSVRVAVKLYSATQSRTVHFHERHAADGAAIEHRSVCSREDKEVPSREIAKGFEVTKGRFVVLEPEEIAAADGRAGHLITIEHFVSRAEIDPVFYDRSYYLGAGAEGGDAYRLLHAALLRSDRAGVGRFVFHGRERLVAVRASEKILTLSVMRFRDELVSPGELDIPQARRRRPARELEMARTLVQQMGGEFDLAAYRDVHREAVMQIIRRKAAGEEIAPTEGPAAEPSEDLLAALEASLKGTRARQGATRGRGSRRPTASRRGSA